jgi:hypothetical protein
MPNYQRVRWITSDDDFIDIDIISKNSRKALILLHGLEGSSGSQYIKGIVHAIQDMDYDIFAMNHRSCSGEINKTSTMYHSGFTQDLTMVLSKLVEYSSIAVVGFSLGGNIILKYLGNHSVPKNLKTAIAISVPVDLMSSAVRLNHWKNRPYAIQFLQTLKKKGIAKAKQFPELLDIKQILQIQTLREFDNLVTAPLHGYKDAEDYYIKASSKPELKNISIPTLLINAQNDTFLAPPCFPYEISKNHKNFHFMAPKFGGHVGFSLNLTNQSFIDEVVVDWLRTHL